MLSTKRCWSLAWNSDEEKSYLERSECFEKFACSLPGSNASALDTDPATSASSRPDPATSARRRLAIDVFIRCRDELRAARRRKPTPRSLPGASLRRVALLESDDQLMARAATKHVCQQCGHQALAWSGRCPGCGEWNTLVETAVAGALGIGCTGAPRPQGGAPRGAAARGRGAGGRPARDRGRRARPCPRRRARPRVARAARRRAGDRQEHDHRDGARKPRRGGPPHALRLRRGVGGAGAAARRAARRRTRSRCRRSPRPRSRP